ncbi:hypothetical protein ACJA88_015257 [Fusarium oxysporum]
MPDNDIRLLALDGGGVRGLSSLIILQNLILTIDPDSPPKPCNYFDIIGGTSTGGLIAIMLGRLQMTVNKYITTYLSLSNKEQFVDGGLGANNPVYALWTQAQDVWGDDRLQASLRCLVLIGTGVPPLRSVHNNVLGIGATLIELATETERTAEQFHRNKSGLDDKGRYYRFNVSYGLKGVGLEESKKQREIAAMTGRYIASQDVFRQIKAYASSLARKQC